MLRACDGVFLTTNSDRSPQNYWRHPCVGLGAVSSYRVVFLYATQPQRKRGASLENHLSHIRKVTESH